MERIDPRVAFSHHSSARYGAELSDKQPKQQRGDQAHQPAKTASFGWQHANNGSGETRKKNKCQKHLPTFTNDASGIRWVQIAKIGHVHNQCGVATRAVWLLYQHISGEKAALARLDDEQRSFFWLIDKACLPSILSVNDHSF
jgi:hypothetical protein